MVHQPVSRGLAVFADAWLLGWLAEISADLRENGSALEVVSRRCAIHIHDFTFYFTQRNVCNVRACVNWFPQNNRPRPTQRNAACQIQRTQRKSWNDVVLRICGHGSTIRVTLK